MRDFAEEVALVWAQQNAGLYCDRPEQFGRDVEAVRRGARWIGGKSAMDADVISCAVALTATEIEGIAGLAATAGARELEPQVAAALRLLAEKGREAP